MKRRRGISLIEVIVTLSLFSAVMTPIALALARAGQWHQAVRGVLEEQSTAARLARQLQRDARLASAVSLSFDATDGAAGEASNAARRSERPASSVRFELADGRRVTYSASTPSVERVVTLAERPVHRELYRGVPGSACDFQRLAAADDSPHAVLQTRLWRSRTSHADPTTTATKATSPWLVIETRVPLATETRR